MSGGGGRWAGQGRGVLVGFAFFLSGGIGLVYEILWSRQLQLFFGSTTEAVSVVLAVFMLGLGLGAHLFGKRIDRTASPLRFYGLLELSIGAYGLLSLPLLGLAGSFYSSVAGTGLPLGVATGFRILLSTLVLLPPCLAMGATLPALLRAVAIDVRTAQRFVGILYALNLFGAVIGSLWAGFISIELLGMRGTGLLAGSLNLAIGTVFVLLARRERKAVPVEVRKGDEEEEEGEGESLLGLLVGSPKGAFTLWGLFISGASVMAFQVLFTRTLAIVFGVSVYAFTTVLAIFLLGLGLGAAIYERWVSKREIGLSQFAWSQLGVALLGAGALALLPAMPRWVLYLRQIPGLGFWEVLAGKAALASLLLFPLATVAGLGVPILLGSLVVDLPQLGRRVGQAYLVNAVGTATGSLLTGFLLVAAWGTEVSLRAVLVANAVTGIVGLLLLSKTGRLRGGLLAASVLVLVARVPGWPPTLFIASDTDGSHEVASSPLEVEERLASMPNELLLLSEGRNATIAVIQSPRTRSLLVNGHPDGSDSRDDMSTQLMLGVIPLTLHPSPKNVLVVGFGTGVSARAAVRFPEVEKVDVVEIEQAVIDASPFFHHVNFAVENDPKVRIVAEDARSFVAASRETYDVIVSEPSNPWRAGVASLYTAEFFADVREILEPGGILAQWMHLYSIRPEELRIVFKTLEASFPEIQVWWLDEGNVVILASDRPLVASQERVRNVLGGEFRQDRILNADLATIDEFYGRLLLDHTDLTGMIRPEDVLHTDDHPHLEFRAPRGLFEADGLNTVRLVAAKLARPTLTARTTEGEPPPVSGWLAVARMYEKLGMVDEEREATRRALAFGGPLAWIRAAELAIRSQDFRSAAAFLQRVVSSGAALDEDLYRELAYAQARFSAGQGNLRKARESFERTGELEGQAGVELLGLLVATQESGPALVLAETLLGAARPGGALDKPEIETIYHHLFDLSTNPAVARSALALMARLPNPAHAFPRLPRLKVEALLAERLDQSEKALAACDEVIAMGLLDYPLLGVRARSLRRLGRIDEADRADALLRELQPRVPLEKIPSPLLDP